LVVEKLIAEADGLGEKMGILDPPLLVQGVLAQRQYIGVQLVKALSVFQEPENCIGLRGLFQIHLVLRFIALRKQVGVADRKSWLFELFLNLLNVTPKRRARDVEEILLDLFPIARTDCDQMIKNCRLQLLAALRRWHCCSPLPGPEGRFGLWL